MMLRDDGLRDGNIRLNMGSVSVEERSRGAGDQPERGRIQERGNFPS